MSVAKTSLGCGVLVLVLAIGAGLGYVIFRNSAASKDAILAAKRNELRQAVITTGTELVAEPPTQDMGYDQETSRLLAIFQQRNEAFQDPELSKAWAQIETDNSTGMAILRRIGQIDQEKPSGYELLARALDDDTKQKDQELGDQTLSRILAEVNKSSLEEDFRQRTSQLDNSILALKPLEDALGGKEQTQAIAVKYLPSWLGTYWGDEVQIENVSGGSLDNSVVAVTTHAASGETRVHLHYTNQWPNGTWLNARYAYGSTDYSNPQAGARPQSIDVAVYAGTSVAHATYELTDDEWDKIVAGYCSGLQFTNVQFLAPYDEDITLKHYDAGFQFAYTGLPTLPIRTVTGKFTSGTGDVQQVTWTYDLTSRLNSGQENPMRSSQVPADPPIHLEITLAFDGTGYQKQVSVY